MIEAITEAFGEPSARLSNTVGVFSAMTRSPILDARFLVSIERKRSSPLRQTVRSWYRRVRPLCYGTITAAPSMESAFKAFSASFTLSRENVVTFGRSLISAAIARKSRASDRVILVTLRI
jgi:hypothetical protein